MMRRRFSESPRFNAHMLFSVAKERREDALMWGVVAFACVGVAILSREPTLAIIGAVAALVVIFQTCRAIGARRAANDEADRAEAEESADLEQWLDRKGLGDLTGKVGVAAAGMRDDG